MALKTRRLRYLPKYYVGGMFGQGNNYLMNATMKSDAFKAAGNTTSYNPSATDILGGASQGFASGTVAGATEGAIHGALSSIPLVNTIDSVLTSITKPIGENAPGNLGNATAGRIDPIGNLSGAIAGAVEGNWNKALTDFSSIVLPGIGALTDVNKYKEKIAAEQNVRNKLNDKQQGVINRRLNPGNYFDSNQQLMQAAMGGPLDPIPDINPNWNPALGQRNEQFKYQYPNGQPMRFTDADSSKYSPESLNQFANWKSNPQVNSTNLSRYGTTINEANSMVLGAQSEVNKLGIPNVAMPNINNKGSISQSGGVRFLDSNDSSFKVPVLSKAMGGSITEYNTGGTQLPNITQYNAGTSHEKSQLGGTPVDSNANVALMSGVEPVALVEKGELAWKNPKTNEAYIFSNRLFIK